MNGLTIRQEKLAVENRKTALRAEMAVEMRSVDDIVPYARNPRQNAAAVDAVAASIAEFGWRQPIVVDTDGIVIVGHTRLLAARKLGLERVPVHVATDLSAAQAKAYRLVDNRTSEFADWDRSLLELELAEIRQVDLSEYRFGDLLSELPEPGVSESSVDANPQPDRAAELASEWGVQAGQLWALGEHMLLCGDSTKADDVARCLGGVVPFLCVTDPPYGVEYDADWRNHALRSDGSPIAGRAVGKVANDDRSDWSAAWALFPGDVIYSWHPAGATSLVHAAALQGSGFNIRMQIIWAKNQFPIGRGDYHVKHELCWYCVREGRSARFTDDRTQTTLWEIDKPHKSETGHSTQKPVECMARPIRNHDSEYVYEPFSGSGTTIIACEQLGRKCLAIEITPGYVAVALQRYLDATGNRPRLVAD